LLTSNIAVTSQCDYYASIMSYINTFGTGVRIYYTWKSCIKPQFLCHFATP